MYTNGVGFALAPAVSVAGSVLSLFGGGDKKRQEKIQADVAAAQSRNNIQDRDYLAYLAAQGNNVTRYEYDNKRRPLEVHGPNGGYTGSSAQVGSGLFQASVAEFGTGPQRSPAGALTLPSVTIPNVGGSSTGTIAMVAGVGLLALFLLKR